MAGRFRRRGPGYRTMPVELQGLNPEGISGFAGSKSYRRPALTIETWYAPSPTP